MHSFRWFSLNSLLIITALSTLYPSLHHHSAQKLVECDWNPWFWRSRNILCIVDRTCGSIFASSISIRWETWLWGVVHVILPMFVSLWPLLGSALESWRMQHTSSWTVKRGNEWKQKTGAGAGVRAPEKVGVVAGNRKTLPFVGVFPEYY